MPAIIRRVACDFVREHFHSRRAAKFLEAFKPPSGSSFLDVGGGNGDFLARLRDSSPGRFVVAELGDAQQPFVTGRGFEFVSLEEGQPLPFADGEFDLVLSISVIEHVTLPKKECVAKVPEPEWRRRAFEAQRRFASEIRRVGKHYFVQTPNRNFPLESHTWLPFVNWFSHNMTVSLLQCTERMWIKKCGYADWNLLSFSDMRALFPDAEIRVERTFGGVKSLIALR